jgi:PTH1 family peptidyl-tRNA hydrolase
MRLVVGLGNPGAEYVGTRHNVGFEVIELLARRHGISVSKRDFKAVLGDGVINGDRVILARPMTFMNLSGESVAALARYYKIEPDQIIVISDDVALPTGQLRLRFQGSAGGHNGLANIIEHMNTSDIPRIRIGVGAPRPGRMRGHVLSRFPAEEAALIEEAYIRAADAVECAIGEGFVMAMNRFNLPKEPKPKQTPKRIDNGLGEDGQKTSEVTP